MANQLMLVLLFAFYSTDIVKAGDGGWSEWSNWSKCTVTCGVGTRRRYRSCDNPPPTHGGKWCTGSLKETGPCEENIECPVDGRWTKWTDWTPCSATCGQGFHQRSRTCSDPKPEFGGRMCEGLHDERENCKNLNDCPRDGGWSAWSSLSSCSVTCGVGFMHRYRFCNNPPPAADGKPCDGKDTHSTRCKATSFCPVNGQWSEWSDWSSCSMTCGQGQRQRLRTCDNPPARHGGAPCNDTEFGHIDVLHCVGSVGNCPVDGGWSEWSEYGPCETVDCQDDRTPAHAFRQRSCNMPFPQHGGTMCNGTFLDAGICNLPTNCKRDGDWSEWSKWTCNENLAKRVRTCDNPPPSHGGADCPPNEAVEVFSRDGNTLNYNIACDIEIDDGDGPMYEDGFTSSTAEDYYFSFD